MMSDVDPKILIRRVDKENNPHLLRDANSILSGYINFNARWPSVKYENNIDWSVNPYDNVSWLSALFSLRMIAVLTTAYEINPNPSYLQKAKEILYSWDDNFDTERLLSLRQHAIWNDHSTANRVINLVHFYYILKSSKLLDEKIEKIIVRHLLQYGEWLYDDKNYTAGNHAVMMDRALLYLSYVLPDYENSGAWNEKALKRFDAIIHDEVTSEGVCVENSPQYHPFMMNLLKDFIQLQTNFNANPSKEQIQLLEKMKSYLVYVLKPDLIYPFQGDSYPGDRRFYFSKEYPDPRFDFIESSGLSGRRPSKVDIVYNEAGYAILRDDWKIGDDFETATYINFIGGFPSRVHKHSDNLSFSLYANKEDLLIDPGTWGYAKNDTVSYLNSTRAHNTFTFNHTDYVNFPLKNCEIISTDLRDEYAVVDGVFKPNPFEKFYRKLVFIKPNYVIIDDHIFSTKKIKATEQIFNLGLNMQSFSVNQQKKMITAEFEHNRLEISQLKNNDYQIENYTGKNGIRGVYALKAEQTVNGNQMVFSTSHDSALHHFHNRTLIRIDNDLESRIEEIDIVDKGSQMEISWIDRKKELRNLKLESIQHEDDVLATNLVRAAKYAINTPTDMKDFGLKDFRVLKWRENEYSIIFKLEDSTTEEKLRQLTIGIRGSIFESDTDNLSTYAKQVNRDYEAWNVKENNIIMTPYGKFISINISTRIKKFREFKLFLFDRSGYKRELWNHKIKDFYLDSELKNTEVLQRIKTGFNVTGAQELTKDFKVDNIFIVNSAKDDLTIYIEVPARITEDIVNQYKIGLHTFVEKGDMDKLLDYSKSKNRNYDAWDFYPELTHIAGKTYIVKRITTPINKFPKIKLFLYNRDGYKGVLGNTVEIEDINLK